jgi:hypothetical protein
VELSHCTKFPKLAAPLAPGVDGFASAWLGPPQPGCAHQLPQGFPANLDLVLLFQTLARQRWPVAGDRFGQNLHDAIAQIRAHPPVRWSSTQLVYHYPVFFGLHPPQQLAHPPLAHLHLFGGFSLRDLLALGLLE